MKNFKDIINLQEAYDNVKEFTHQEKPTGLEEKSPLIRLVKKHFPKNAERILQKGEVDLGYMNGWNDNVKEFFNTLFKLRDSDPNVTVSNKRFDDGTFQLKVYYDSDESD